MFHQDSEAVSEVGCGYSSGVIKFCNPFDYIVEKNTQKIPLVPIPALEKGKASQNRYNNPLETPLLDLESPGIISLVQEVWNDTSKHFIYRQLRALFIGGSG